MGEERALVLVGFEPGAVGVVLLLGESAVDRLACDFAGPGWVGAVELGWVGVAAAVGFAACGVALGDAAGQREAAVGQLRGDARGGGGWGGVGFGIGWILLWLACKPLLEVVYSRV